MATVTNSANTGNFITGEDVTGLNPRVMIDIVLDRSDSRTVVVA
jgi:hypothetical protein